tara:strand:- start:817 stop:1146 length:330 start_codon:yes stop_codon:yes gene_type:complete
MSYRVDLGQFNSKLKEGTTKAIVKFPSIEQAMAYGIHKMNQANKRNLYAPVSEKTEYVESFDITTEAGLYITIASGEKEELEEEKVPKTEHKEITLIQNDDSDVTWICE